MNEEKIESEAKMRAGRKEMIGIVAACSAAALLCGTASFYIVKAQYYEEHFFPNTRVNGVLVEGCTPKEAAGQIARGLSDYELTLICRNGTERIRGGEIGLHAEFTDDLKEIIRDQNPYAWGKGVINPGEFTIPTVTLFDEDLFDKAIDGFSCLTGDAVTEPENARISDYIPGVGYEIIPENQGQKLDRSRVEQAVSNAVLAMETEIDLEQSGCYLSPQILSNDPQLHKQCSQLNRLVQTVVTYQFGDKQEILDGTITHQWIREGENGSFTLDSEMAARYVSDLASKYNTAYTSRYFQTSYGPVVKVSGSYGWRINQKEETAQLMQILEEGNSQSREPVYFQKAASHSGNDYGTTYAEVNLTAQHMFFYQDGKKVLESDFVSGNVRKNHTTPPGIFGLTYKQKDAVLKGEGYASPVDFWMPFNGGIGFHDATWRSSFGGSIYKTNGSHGCINMPYAKAKELYSLVYTNVPVICYNLEGTESGKATNGGASAKPQKPAQSKPQLPAPTPSQPPVPTQPQQPTLPQPAPTQPAPVHPDPGPAGPTLPAPQNGTGESGPVITPVQPTEGGTSETLAPSETLPAAPSGPHQETGGVVITPEEESRETGPKQETGQIGPGATAPALPATQPEIGHGTV